MSNNFTEIMNSQSFLQAYGFNNKGLCFVEDESDIPFWDFLINKNISKKFDIKPASSTINPHARGKIALSEKIQYLSKDQIIAIDSDYDYILKTINKEKFNNKYILQTFFYSRESIIYRHERLNSIISQVKYNIEKTFNLKEFIEFFSSKCYETLIGISYLYKNELIQYSQLKDNINDVLDLGYKKNIFNENMTLNHQYINKIDENLKEKLEGYNVNINSEDFKEFKLNNEYSELNELNAYQYIDGHLLEDYLNSFFKIVISHLKKIESLRIVSESTGVRQENRRKHIKDQTEKMEKHFDLYCNYLTLINNLLAEDFSSSCYHKIIEKIIAIENDSN